MITTFHYRTLWIGAYYGKKRRKTDESTIPASKRQGQTIYKKLPRKKYGTASTPFVP
jgi:hypothetical protein